MLVACGRERKRAAEQARVLVRAFDPAAGNAIDDNDRSPILSLRPCWSDEQCWRLFKTSKTLEQSPFAIRLAFIILVFHPRPVSRMFLAPARAPLVVDKSDVRR